MMRLPAFQFVAPKTVAEVTRLLADHGPQAALAAGGTDLYPNLKRRQATPATVIGLHNVPDLHGVREAEDGRLVIGASTTLSHLERHPLIRRAYPALVEAILTVSTPLLRNMGTIGGNLCLDTRCHFLNQTFFWRQAMGSCMKAEGDICRVAPSSKRCLAITSADLPPLLIALDAQIRLADAGGERQIPLADLYQDDGIGYLNKAAGELLTEVILPPPSGIRAAYLKLRRRGTFDFPALGVAAAIRIGGDGLCDAARIVLGAITSSPMVLPEAQALVGQKLDDGIIGPLAETIRRRVRPLHLADYDHLYRKRMTGLYVRRVLEHLAYESH